VANDSFDHAILAGGVAPLDQHYDLVTVLDEVPLKLHQLDLEPMERSPISSLPRTRGRGCVLH
jgi:hypothetical protein